MKEMTITVAFVVLWQLSSLVAWICWNRLQGWETDTERFENLYQRFGLFLFVGLIPILTFGNFYWWTILKREIENG